MRLSGGGSRVLTRDFEMGPEEGNMRVEEKGHICELELVTTILYVTEHVGHFLSLSFFLRGGEGVASSR